MVAMGSFRAEVVPRRRALGSRYAFLDSITCAETLRLLRAPSITQPLCLAKIQRTRNEIKLAGELGFEPRLTESESAVLPLNYSPTVRSRR